MLSSALHSDRAAEVNVAIMRTFVKLRQMLASNRDLARKVQEHDQKIAVLFDTVHKLLTPPDPKKTHRAILIRKTDCTPRGRAPALRPQERACFN